MIDTEIQINPSMLVLARESRGLSQKFLAEKIGISPALLCRFEQDNRNISDEIVTKLSKQLQYPIDFFYQESEAHIPTSMSYRKRDHVNQKLLMPLEAQINIYRLNIETLTEKLKLPVPNLPIYDLEKFESPEKVAKELRKKWKVPKGPVENMIELLEQNGIMVISFDFGTERVDSRTVFTQKKQPVIVINKAHLSDRQRFSMAHELGHMVLHAFTSPSHQRDIRHESNLFAAGLLLPESEISKDFENDISIPLLGELKRKWKVSMQSLLFRASDLGFLTENQKRYLLAQFNALKIRRREPPELDIPKEKPRLLRDLMTKYRTAHRMSIKELAAEFCLEQEDFMKHYSD